MNLEDIKKIGVVGAGNIGHGIALSFALWGYPTIMCDINDDILKNAIRLIKLALDTFVEEEVLTSNQTNDIMGRITPTTDLEILARDIDYVCESIIETPQDKNQLFKKLDAMCPGHTIIASNTASMLLNDFASDVKRQDKILITHYFNPPYILPCVEMVKGPGTSDETFNLIYELLLNVKKVPVRVLKAMPGYLVNRMQTAMMREVFDLWAKGVASAEDIDRAVCGSFGLGLATIGPLLKSDLTGMPKQGPVVADMFNRLFRQISDAKEIPEKLNKQWGNYQGFYNYSPDKLANIVKQRDKEYLRRLKQNW